MKVWISKYALSSGIAEIDAKEVGNGMVQQLGVRHAIYYHGEGRDWHRTPEAAHAHAEQMRVKKIASLEKQIAKLKSIKFSADKICSGKQQ